MSGRLLGRSGKLRAVAGVVVLGVVVAGLAATVVGASGARDPEQHVTAGKAKGKGRGATSTTTTTTPSTTTGVVPYGLQSVAVSGLTYTASKSSTTVAGSFVVTNTGDTISVVVDSQSVGVEYRTSKGTFTAMPPPSCTLSPAVPYTVVQQQSVGFTCQLASRFPASAQYARVTVSVTLLGSTTSYSTSAQKAL